MRGGGLYRHSTNWFDKCTWRVMAWYNVVDLIGPPFFFLSPMILQMTGLSTSVLLAKSTTITAEQKFHSGKNQKNGLKGQHLLCVLSIVKLMLYIHYISIIPLITSWIVCFVFYLREQRQKEASKMSVNSFPKDRDYRREVMQATSTSGFASGSKYFF